MNKIIKSILDSSMFWASLHFPAKDLKHYLKFQCLTLGAHLSERIRCHKVGVTKHKLVSVTLDLIKKLKRF